MGKAGEIEYLQRIGEHGRRHAQLKPFSDPERGQYLQSVGVVLDALPPPPARVLDLGCGTGWTTEFLHRSGYEAVGIDIAPDMIALAREMPGREGVRFEIGDYEILPELGAFDAAMFFDSLHHAEDERAALAAVYGALVPRGRLVCSEPGAGHSHAAASQHAVNVFGVTEKDMPPSHIISIGREVGFRSAEVLPSPVALAELFDRARALDTVGDGERTLSDRLRSSVKTLIAAPTVAALGGKTGRLNSYRGEYAYYRLVRATLLDLEHSGVAAVTVLYK